MWAKEHNGKLHQYWLGIKGNKYGFMTCPYDSQYASEQYRVIFQFNSIWFRLK